VARLSARLASIAARLLVALVARYPSALERLLAFLEARGRKWLLVNFDGAIAVQRWYLVYAEKDDYRPGEPRPWYTRLPNAYIHKDVQLLTPGSAHRHAWNTASIILRGGYTELVDGLARTHRAGDIALLSHRQHHEIVRCEPGTLTLFCHGFRLDRWWFRVAPCERLCATCAPKGACLNARRVTPYEENVGTPQDWRMTAWFPSRHPGLDKMIARRRRALARGAIRVLSRDEVLAAAAKRIEGGGQGGTE